VSVLVVNRLTRIYGAVNLAFGTVLGVIVLEVLPARQPIVDVLGMVTSLLLLGSGLGMLMGAPWAARLGRLAATVHLGFGILLFGAILLSVGFLHGIYGAIGEGGTAVLLVLLALDVPYFIVLPILELVHLRRLANEAPSS
jgi:hypothetical protein